MSGEELWKYNTFYYFSIQPPDSTPYVDLALDHLGIKWEYFYLTKQYYIALNTIFSQFFNHS